MFQELSIGSEREIETEVTISNATDSPQTFRVAAYDFGNLDESGGVAFLGASGELDQAYTLSEWMTLSRDLVTLPPRGSEAVTVTIKNDTTLGPGGHYGAVVFESVEADVPNNPNRIAVSQMIASLIFAKKTEGAQYGLELAHSDVARGLFSLTTANLVFRNTGNVHAVPRGVVRVMDPAGRTTLRGIINEASSLVLPGQERSFSLELAPIAWLWLPGWYDISIEYRYDGREEFDVASQRRFLIPLIPSASLIGGGLIWGAWRIYRKRRLFAEKSHHLSV